MITVVQFNSNSIRIELAKDGSAVRISNGDHAVDLTREEAGALVDALQLLLRQGGGGVARLLGFPVPLGG